MGKGIEVNGPANIIMYLRGMLDNGRISKKDYDLLVNEAEKIIDYMNQLYNPKQINWSEVKKKSQSS